MVISLKCLLCKHGNLNLDPKLLHKWLTMVTHAYNPDTCKGRGRLIPGTHWSSSLPRLTTSRVSGNCGHLMSASGLHTHAHTDRNMYAYISMHMHAHVHPYDETLAMFITEQ